MDVILKDVEGGGCCFFVLMLYCFYICWIGEEGGGDKIVFEIGVILCMFGF